jgi:23S rRNA pseudouridine2605 synthase
MQERIQKLMAQAGIASRRDAEALIAEGRVTVNGQRANLGDKADPAVDDVRVDGERLRVESERVYVMLNKPMGVVTAVRAQEQEKRRTVRDLVPVEGHLYPVGRLDADSEGLVLLTNDGELAERLSHPRYQHPKVYEVLLPGAVTDEALDIWRRGILLDDGLTMPVEIRVLTRDKDATWIRVTMREGRKRQIRRIASTLGYPVKRLIRTELDALQLGALKTGEWRYLTDAEIKALQQSAASTPRHGKKPPAAEPIRPARKAAGTGKVRAPRRPANRSAKRPTGRAGSRTTGRPANRPARRSPAGRKSNPPGASKSRPRTAPKTGQKSRGSARRHDR